MKKAKILYIITQSEWGGAQKYVFDLSRSLKDEFDVAVAFGGRGKLKNRLDEENIRTFLLKNLVREINPWKDFLGFWEIYRLIKEEQPDIVHTNSSKAEILGNLAAALSKTKRIIHTAHGFVFNEPMSRWKRSFYVSLERLANRFTSFIICVSDYDREKALLHRITSASKLTTVHNGIETKNISRSEKDQTQKTGKFIVITIANFYPTKGLSYLIEAASILSSKINDLDFWILGEGRERKFLERIIRHYNLENVKLLGFKNDSFEYLNKSDIFVLPSVKEGFPYTILEAMAAGLPIVATHVGGVPEIITEDENGFLVPSANSQALAEKISVLRESYPKRSEMSQKNRRKVSEFFSLEKMIEKTKEIYLK